MFAKVGLFSFNCHWALLFQLFNNVPYCSLILLLHGSVPLDGSCTVVNKINHLARFVGGETKVTLEIKAHILDGATHQAIRRWSGATTTTAGKDCFWRDQASVSLRRTM